MEELIAKRYAKALMEISKSDDLENIVQSLQDISSSLNEEKIKELVSNPLISKDKKFENLIAPLKDKIDDNLYKLLAIMSDENRLSLVPTLAEILSYEMKMASNSFEGTISSDGTLEEDDIKKLEERLSQYTGATIQLKDSDKKIDGIKVEVNDLGIELSYSKDRVKADLLAFIQQGL